MHYKISYGAKPQLTAADKEMFSRGEYSCRELFQTKDGKPVAVLRNTITDIWMVRHGFSSIIFGDYHDAMAYCCARFRNLDGSSIRM